MVLEQGRHQIGDITMEVGQSPRRLNRDSTWISFTQPFPEGVTPVVITTLVSRSKNSPYMAKILDITHEGFAVKVVRQAAVDAAGTTFSTQNLSYVAATPGSATMEDGHILTVGRNPDDLVDGIRAREVSFVDASGNAQNLFKPHILCGPQTNRLDLASVYRYSRLEETEIETEEGTATAVNGIRIIRQRDNTAQLEGMDNYIVNGDVMGWIIVSEKSPQGGSSVAPVRQHGFQVSVHNGRIHVTGADHYEVYDLYGRRIPSHSSLPAGLYVVKCDKGTQKVWVRSAR